MGADADIVIVDPRAVTGNASFQLGEGALPSEGLPYVLVNGVIVIKDSEVQKGFPGKPIRFRVLASGHLDQLDTDPREFVPNQ